MKTAISIPDPLFAAAEDLARRMGLSRSELFQRAVKDFLEEHKDAVVTEALDEVYGKEDAGRLDAVLEQLEIASLPREEWE
ncbi:MAG TPA: ribbon-helix-helix protein, CopG family [bacterium]|jgi:predicted transcriptional regulator